MDEAEIKWAVLKKEPNQDDGWLFHSCYTIV